MLVTHRASKYSGAEGEIEFRSHVEVDASQLTLQVAFFQEPYKIAEFRACRIRCLISYLDCNNVLGYLLSRKINAAC